MNIQYIPNTLSISRFFFSLFLLFFFRDEYIFITLYFLIGITDALDGFIARKYKIESSLGAKLDSVGDLSFFAIVTLYLISEHKDILSSYIVFILIVFLLRIANIIIGFIKYKRLTMLHTIANKITGLLIYLLPIILILERRELLLIIFAVSLFSPVEESIIILQSPKDKINLNKKSIFTS